MGCLAGVNASDAGESQQVFIAQGGEANRFFDYSGLWIIGKLRAYTAILKFSHLVRFSTADR